MEGGVFLNINMKLKYSTQIITLYFQDFFIKVGKNPETNDVSQKGLLNV
jgi:hypothetical protein